MLDHVWYQDIIESFSAVAAAVYLGRGCIETRLFCDANKYACYHRVK